MARIDHRDIRTAWAEGRTEDLLRLLKRASTRVIRRAHDELQSLDGDRAAAFRSWLESRGIELVGRPGAQPPTVGSVRDYSVLAGKGQTYIRLPVSVIGRERGEKAWATFISADTIIVTRHKPEAEESKVVELRAGA